MSFSAKQMALLSDLHKDLGKALIVAVYAFRTLGGDPLWIVALVNLVGALLAIGISLYCKYMEEQLS